jgi:hypothetical protein
VQQQSSSGINCSKVHSKIILISATALVGGRELVLFADSIAELCAQNRHFLTASSNVKASVFINQALILRQINTNSKFQNRNSGQYCVCRSFLEPVS